MEKFIGVRGVGQSEFMAQFSQRHIYKQGGCGKGDTAAVSMVSASMFGSQQVLARMPSSPANSPAMGRTMSALPCAETPLAQFARFNIASTTSSSRYLFRSHVICVPNMMCAI